MMQPIKVFLSAYACEPGKGSEPGVGWNWACGLAGRVELTVLTRVSNRSSIEAALQHLPADDPRRSVRFLYHDLAKPFLWAKRAGLLPTMAYYILWQRSVAKCHSKVAAEADIVHHLTFCTLLCPGFWNLERAKYVLGPVGAPQVNPHYLPLFGSLEWMQRLRGRILGRFLRLSWLRRLLLQAAALVPANRETRELLRSQGLAPREVMLDTGAPEEAVPLERGGKEGAIRLIYAGQLERRKGLELALRALVEVSAAGNCDWRLTLLGNGPDRIRLKALAEDLGIGERVEFVGPVPRSEVIGHFAKADAFLFPSVRDTSGGVNLEAMSTGLPVICIAHQGVGDITNDSCAERIAPAPIPETIRGLAAAILRLSADPHRRLNMGAAAAQRARESFSWEEKFDRMISIYAEVMNSGGVMVPSRSAPGTFELA
jgi:glycosyltransferase involved in cell wall biosynthesis